MSLKHQLLTAASLLIAASFASASDIADITAPRTIDVIVSDRGQNHIKGLTQADFQIFEDGKQRDIEKFAEQSYAAGVADTQPPRSILLIFDETSISLAARRTTVDALREFVNTRVRPIDKVMVVTIAGIGGVFPATGWTSSKEKLLEALAKSEAAALGNKSNARREAERQIQENMDVDRQSGVSGSPITFGTLMQVGRNYALNAQRESDATNSAISQALAFLGSGPGKKIAVIAGGGLSTRPGSELFQYLEDLRQQAMLGQLSPGVQRGASASNPLGEVSQYDIGEKVREIAQNAHDRGIVVYTIDSESNGTSDLAVERTRVTNTSQEFAGITDKMGGYQIYSKVTGGMLLIGRSTAIPSIAADLDSHYLVTYTQTLNAHGNLPKVVVKVTKSGYDVRSSFAGGPPTTDSDVQETVIANHLVPKPVKNDMQIALANDAPVADGDNKLVKLRVIIPVKSLKFVQDAGEFTTAFAVYISTGDGDGNSSPVNRQTQQIRWAPDQMQKMSDKMIPVPATPTINNVHGRTRRGSTSSATSGGARAIATISQ